MNHVVGSEDLLLLTLDTLRYDVALRGLREGRTANLARWLGDAGWEERHSPSSFTYAAHCAFFAGFLPTPVSPGPHPRPFALRFEGSESIGPGTCVLEGANVVEGLAARGYHTACIGGVGFFNRKNPLGRVLPSLFAESHWDESLGVTDRDSFEHQVERAEQVIERLSPGRRLFLFVNVSALHQPNRLYVDGAVEDGPDTQLAALAYVDSLLPRLFAALGRRGPCHAILCSDHGTAYGEAGHRGHRHAQEVVWTVPYAELALEAAV
ncbi:MAG: STM4013/SEN3800 family hydrolase [Myxococcota bacterium]|nr:STM4013/SEN3800 family hydrolase [Myxococcota bacterium]